MKKRSHRARHGAAESMFMKAGHKTRKAPGAYELENVVSAGMVSLYVNGKKDGEGRVDQTIPMVFGTETCDIGEDACAPVSSDYDSKTNQFFGQVNWVQIDLEKDDQDHLISSDERFRVAMARQSTLGHSITGHGSCRTSSQ